MARLDTSHAFTAGSVYTACAPSSSPTSVKQPAESVRATDAQMASAFRDLETAVCKLRGMVLLMEMAAGDAIQQRGGFMVDNIKQKIGPMKGYQIFVMTDDQADSLDHAINQVGDLMRSLRDEFYAGFDVRVAGQ